MSNFKEVNISLTPADEKALSRGGTRRRKTARKSGGGDEVAVVDQVAPPLPTTQTPQVPLATQPQAPLPIPQTPQTPQTPQPAVGGVRIQTRKRHQSHVGNPAITRKVVGATIVPIKRHAVPEKTKPKLIITAPIPTPAKSAAPAKPTLTKPTLTNPTSPAPVKPIPTKPILTKPTLPTRKRRFAERKLSISLKQSKKTHKAHKHIKRKVRTMSVEEIQKTLREKGILKSAAAPPEKILRSMMRDYLLLNH